MTLLRSTRNGIEPRSAEDRVAELSAFTGVLTPFVIEYHTTLDNAQDAEREIHIRFSANSVSGSREFVCVDLDELVSELNDIRLAQILLLMENIEKEFHPAILSHLLRQDPALLHDPEFQPGRLDTAIAALLRWDTQ